MYVLLLLVTTGSPHCTLSIVYNLNSLWAPLSTDESPERTTQAGWWRDGTHCIITHLKLKSEIEMNLISCCIPRTKIPNYRKVASFLVILASIFLVISQLVVQVAGSHVPVRCPPPPHQCGPRCGPRSPWPCSWQWEW